MIRIASEISLKEWFDVFNKKNKLFNLPNFISTKEELFLSVIMGLWIIKKLVPKTTSLTSFDSALKSLNLIKETFHVNKPLWDHIEVIFSFSKNLEDSSNLFDEKRIDFEAFLIDDKFGTFLQKSLDKDYRKKIAANFTTLPSSQIICESLPQKLFIKIIDPFCGSGRLITTFLNNITDLEAFPKQIQINDLIPSSVIIAYARILLILIKRNVNPHILIATIDDAFNMISTTKNRFGLVLMNPPFTRTHRIDNRQKENLNLLIDRYKDVIKGQIGLHIYSILLADILLQNNGVMGTILPASTVSSTYSKGIQKFLLSRQELNLLLSSKSSKSFSEDSELNEIIIISTKKTVLEDYRINFSLISDDMKKQLWNISSTKSISLDALKSDWNWMRHFQSEKILSLRIRILKTGKIQSGSELTLKITRGVEMYGPEFFFIPNKIYKHIKKTDTDFLISSEENELNIPAKILVKALRKPSKYSGFISPKVDDYVIAIPETEKFQSNSFKNYLDTNKSFATPALKKFNDKWINHIAAQLDSKKPWGYLFFVDKHALTSVSNNIFFLDDQITCSKNFYVLTNRNYKESKFLAAWLNSSFYYLLFLNSRREIGGSYGRMQIIDLMREKIFLDIDECSSIDVDRVLEAFDGLRSKKLSPLPDQIGQVERRRLDEAIAKTLKFSKEEIPSVLESLYYILLNSFKEMKKRDGKQSTRST